MRTITIFNIDFIQRIITPDEINPRVDGSSFIPPLNELPTSQLLTFLQTPITNHFSEKFQNYFLHFMLRSPGLLLMIWVVWSGAPQPFVGACCIELHRNRWHCPNPSAVTIWIFTAAKSSNLGRLTFWSLTTYIYIFIYRMSQEERTKLREGVPYAKLYRYNPKHLYPKLNGYGDNGKWSLKLWQLLHTYWLPNS